jgi:hypothetical protein
MLFYFVLPFIALNGNAYYLVSIWIDVFNYEHVHVPKIGEVLEILLGLFQGD